MLKHSPYKFDDMNYRLLFNTTNTKSNKIKLLIQALVNEEKNVYKRTFICG